jgi:hypothetical protein
LASIIAIWNEKMDQESEIIFCEEPVCWCDPKVKQPSCRNESKYGSKRNGLSAGAEFEPSCRSNRLKGWIFCPDSARERASRAKDFQYGGKVVGKSYFVRSQLMCQIPGYSQMKILLWSFNAN